MARFSVLLLLLPGFSFAQDAAQGRALYGAYCGGCHYERVHQRIRSDVRDLGDLRDAVARWSSHRGEHHESSYSIGVAGAAREVRRSAAV